MTHRINLLYVNIRTEREVSADAVVRFYLDDDHYIDVQFDHKKNCLDIKASGLGLPELSIRPVTGNVVEVHLI